MAFDIEKMEIAELRRLAAVHKIDTQKDWKKDDYIRAIQNRHKRQSVARIVNDESDPIPAGFCRIRIHLGYGGSDSPVSIKVNNFNTMIPRNVVVDIPKEARDQLRNSKESVAKEAFNKNGEKYIEISEVPAYPFDDLGSTPGDSGAVRPITDPREQRLREKYRSLYGKWPRRQSEEWKTFKNGFLEIANKRVQNEAVEEEISSAND